MTTKVTNKELIKRVRQLEKLVYELRQVKSSLLEDQEKLYTFLDHMPGDVFLKDKDSNYIYSNNQKYFKAHFKGKDIINRSTKEVWPKELAEKFINPPEVFAVATADVVEVGAVTGNDEYAVV